MRHISEGLFPKEVARLPLVKHFGRHREAQVLRCQEHDKTAQCHGESLHVDPANVKHTNI